MGKILKPSSLKSFSSLILVILIASFLFLSIPLLAQTISTFTFSFSNAYGSYSATTYYLQAMSNRPVILFLHSFASLNTWYTWMQQPVLEAGYILVMLEVPNPLFGDIIGNVTQNLQTREPVYAAAFSSCITSILTQNQLTGKIDSTKIYVAGHSLGALGAIQASTQDARIKAVSAWSPPFDLSGITLPKPMTLPCSIQIVIGSEEGAMYTSAINYYNQVQAPSKNLTVIQGGNHMQYLDQSEVSLESLIQNIIPIPFVGNEPATITVNQQHQIAITSLLSFLQPTIQPTSAATPTSTPSASPSPSRVPTGKPTPTPTPSSTSSTPNTLPSPSPFPSPNPSPTANPTPTSASKPTDSPNQTQTLSQALTRGVIYGIAVAISIMAIVAVVLVLRKRNGKMVKKR